MRLCIADPPYLGYASIWYGSESLTDEQSEGTVPVDNRRRPNMGGSTSSINPPHKADRHEDAHIWDRPQAHRDLVARLCNEFDGWAIALNPGNLVDYLTWTPQPYRIAVWAKPNAMPTNSRPIKSWEPVLIRVPEGRRRGTGRVPTRDYLVAPKDSAFSSSRFAGAKPPAWTRWVLDMLGYQPENDTVVDLFAGSGSVANEIAQGVLL